MVHRIGQHDPVDVNGAIVMTDAQMSDLKDFLSDLLDPSKVRPQAVMSDDQFARLEGMLQPGFELSKGMLAQQRGETGQPEPSAHMQAEETHNAALNAERPRLTADVNERKLGSDVPTGTTPGAVTEPKPLADEAPVEPTDPFADLGEGHNEGHHPTD